MQNSWLYILDRDLAKRVFGCRDDQTMQSLIAELEDAATSCVTLSQAERLAEAYETIGAARENSGLAFAIRGGRSMHQGDAWRVFLVRPDIVRGLASELASATTASAAELSDPNLQREHDAVSDLYSKAASAGGAVLFVAGGST